MGRKDFGRYKIVEEVGRGAMGVVYRATDPVMGRAVAIKAINQSYLEGLGVGAAEYFERFRREAEVAGRLSHPNIVKIFDLGADYLVMEFVEGQSLSAMLHAKARLPPARILQVVAEVADALDYAHVHGIVHRDVKPANIMIQSDGSAKVMDFGLARIESSTLTAAGEVLGSASYMAPEVILGRPADARSDIFSLGVMAYEMMTDARPFGAGSITLIIQNIVHGSPRPARELNWNLPPEYDAIFERVLAKEASARYPTASAFASELNLRKWAEPELPTPAPTAAARPARAEDGARTIPPGERPIVPREPVPDAGAATLLMAEGAGSGSGTPAGNAGGGGEEVDAAGATVLMADVGEVSEVVAPPEADAGAKTLSGTEKTKEGPLGVPASVVAQGEAAPAADGDVVELPEGSLEPVETTDTHQPGVEKQAARGAAAARLGVSDVLGKEPQTAAAKQAPGAAGPVPAAGAPVAKATSRKGVPLVLVLAVAALVLLGFAAGIGFLAYHMLVRPATTTAPEAAAEGTLSAAPETTVPAEATGPEASPAPEPSPAPEESTPAPESAAPETPSPEATAAPTTTLAPALATLRVSSDPPGAAVTVGKKPRGLTPLRVQLRPGKLAIVVEKEGFKPWRKDVTLAAAGLEVVAQLEALPKKAAATPAPTPAGVRTGDLVALGPDVTPPKRIEGGTPRLPSAATKRKLSGSVVVEFVVDEEGRVTDPKVVESAGDVLDAASLEAIRAWRYEPATKQGVRVKVVSRAKFTFVSR